MVPVQLVVVWFPHLFQALVINHQSLLGLCVRATTNAGNVSAGCIAQGMFLFVSFVIAQPGVAPFLQWCPFQCRRPIRRQSHHTMISILPRTRRAVLKRALEAWVRGVGLQSILASGAGGLTHRKGNRRGASSTTAPLIGPVISIILRAVSGSWLDDQWEVLKPPATHHTVRKQLLTKRFKFPLSI